MVRRPPISTEAQKLAFLQQHEQELRDASPDQVKAILTRLGAEMKKQGLYRSTTQIADIVLNNNRRLYKLGWLKNERTKIYGRGVIGLHPIP